MNSNLKLTVFVFAAFAVAETAHRLSAQNTTGSAQVNPSQNATPQNPSQTIQTPSPDIQTPLLTSPQDPNRVNALNPGLASPTGTTVPSVPLVTDSVPVTPVMNMANPQRLERVRASIVQAPMASNGAPSATLNGVSVTDLKVTELNGKVVLQGVVHSEKDKSEAEARALTAAGAGNVINQLIVR